MRARGIAALLLGVAVAGAGAGGMARLRRRQIEASRRRGMADLPPALPLLVAGLARHPDAISQPELDLLNKLYLDPAIVGLLYVDRYGDVRWDKDAATMGRSFDDVSRERGLDIEAIESAWRTKEPTAKELPRGVDELAIPVTAGGVVFGILDVRGKSLGGIETAARLLRERALKIPRELEAQAAASAAPTAPTAPVAAARADADPGTKPEGRGADQ